MRQTDLARAVIRRPSLIDHRCLALDTGWSGALPVGRPEVLDDLYDMHAAGVFTPSCARQGGGVGIICSGKCAGEVCPCGPTGNMGAQ
jgi:hypothetical protein